MSAVTAFIFLVLLPAAGIVGWKGALWWNNRTRDPNAEDPRDQEIRELSAALSIARKELAKTSEEKDGTQSAASELQEKLNHSNAALADTQQKFNATKDHLNREIEQKEELIEENRLVKRELDSAKARISELEVQAKMSAPSSGMIAGLDMVDEDDQAEERVAELEAEVDRWKQHCTVMSKTNKALRTQNEALKEELENVSAAAASSELTDSLPMVESAPPEPATEAVAANGNGEMLKDDLQSIRGVGEKLEQKLNLLGIFSFRGIIGIDDATLDRANLVIPNLEKRMSRESWFDQARALHLQKYNEVI